jgi:hypothetical protein
MKYKKKKGSNVVIYIVVITIALIIILLNVLAHKNHNTATATIASTSTSIVSEKSPSVISISNKEPLVLWSSDFHIATIADIKHFLVDKNVKIIDKVIIITLISIKLYYHYYFL